MINLFFVIVHLFPFNKFVRSMESDVKKITIHDLVV